MQRSGEGNEAEPVLDPNQPQELEEEAEGWRYVPPWIQDEVEERELEQGRKLDPTSGPPVEGDDEGEDENPPG